MAQPSESAAIRELRGRVSSLLMSDECQEVNFTLENAVVDSSAFTYVALALVGCSMKFSIQPWLSGAEAVYQIQSNTFVFKKAGYGLTPGFEQMSIVHEATHALIDATSKGRKVLKITNEMAAFIAGALFNVICGSPYTPPGSGIFYEADKIANRMCDVIAKWGFSGNYLLYAADVKGLRAAVIADPIYSDIKANPNSTYGDDGVVL